MLYWFWETNNVETQKTTVVILIVLPDAAVLLDEWTFLIKFLMFFLSMLLFLCTVIAIIVFQNQIVNENG